MRVLFINNNGTGFADYVHISEGTTVEQFFKDKMQAVGKRHHHATGQDGQGHTILKVCLYYRGVTIPWARQRQRRQIVWQEEIKNVIKVSHDKNVIHL